MTERDMIEWFKAAPMGSRQQRMLWAAHKIARLTGATEGGVYQTLERSLERAGLPPTSTEKTAAPRWSRSLQRAVSVAPLPKGGSFSQPASVRSVSVLPSGRNSGHRWTFQKCLLADISAPQFAER